MLKMGIDDAIEDIVKKQELKKVLKYKKKRGNPKDKINMENKKHVLEYKIGIMQGRVLPVSVDRLQVFPDEWSNELLAIKKIGFDYVELLDDKKCEFRKLLIKDKNKLFNEINESGVGCVSVCMDRLCDFSLLNDEYNFLNELKWLVENMFDKKVKFVIPFFDNNKIKNEFELYSCLVKLARYDKFLFDKGLYFSLEIDLPAEIVYQALRGFSFRNIGFCYDLGNNIGHGRDLYAEIKLLGKYINHVHIKDKVEGVNSRIRQKNPMMQSAFKALDEISYEGAMIMETCIKPYPLKEARKNLGTVKKYLKNNSDSFIGIKGDKK